MATKQDTKILVVDDCEDNLLVMRIFLEMEGYQACVANSGKRALEKVNKVRPDLIILDLMMPDMDGLEVINSLKQNKFLSNIPTMLLTANVCLKIEDAVSADELCYKPCNFNEVLEKVQSMLSNFKPEEFLNKLSL